MALTDALGNLIDFRLLPRQAYDLRGTAALINGPDLRPVARRPRVRCQLGARGPRRGRDRGGHPAKSNRRFPANFDRDTYKWRHLIENFFQKLKEYRGIAMRCCKTDASYAAFVALSATVIRLK